MDPRFGGPSQGIRNLVPELDKLGHKNVVVSLDDPNEVFVSKANFKLIALGKGKGRWNVNKSLRIWLDQNMQMFDIVIIHGLWLYPGYAVRQSLIQHMSSGEIKIKIYVMPHGMLDPYFQTSPKRIFKALRNWLYWKLLESKLISIANGVLFTCEQELILARCSFKPYNQKQKSILVMEFQIEMKWTMQSSRIFQKTNHQDTFFF